MQPLAASLARTEALREAHQRLDPASADMLEQLTYDLRDIASILREASILLSLPAIATTSASLRDRIDIKLGIVARPISQTDGS